MPKVAKAEAEKGAIGATINATSPEYLFVYGSLRATPPREGWPGEAAAARCALMRYADHVGPGSIQGRLYDVDWYPGAVSSRTPAERVCGDVYCIRDRAALLSVLDAYEAAAPPRSVRRAGAEYIRDRRSVRLADGARLSAWVYLFDAPTDGLTRVESGDYVAWLDAAGRKGRSMREADAEARRT